MNFAAKPLNRTGLILLAGSIALSGCATPPSVAPLLRASQLAMTQEKSLLDADLVRSRTQIQQSRAVLEAAYEADLKARPNPAPQWVMDATRAYVAAREALVRHEAELVSEHDRRSDNLSLAEQAQDRAITILEKQDELLNLTGINGWKLRDLLHPAR